MLIACNPDDDKDSTPVPTPDPIKTPVTQYVTEMRDAQGMGYTLTYDGSKVASVARTSTDKSKALTATFEYTDTLLTRINKRHTDGTEHIDVFQYDNLGTLKSSLNVSLANGDTTEKAIDTFTFDESHQLKSCGRIIVYSREPVNSIMDTTVTYYTWNNGNIEESDTYVVLGTNQYLQYRFTFTYDSMRNFSNQSLAIAYSVSAFSELGLSKNNCTSVIGNSGSGPQDLGSLKYTYNENGYPVSRERSGRDIIFFSATLKYK